MLGRFLDYIAEQHLFPTGQEVLLAVSGGRDSVAMAELFHRAGIPFAIAHCNFHLRSLSSTSRSSLPDCDRDQRFVQALAKAYGVPFHTADFDTHAYASLHRQSIEEAARELRYSFFATLCVQRGYVCVATAHHRDDAVETFFLNLFRGTGIAGLHGISPFSELHMPAGTVRVVHPMLPFSRNEINMFVARHSLAYVDDYTNELADVRRNQLRLKLLPTLRTSFPDLDTVMTSNMARFSEAGILYAERVEEWRSALVHQVESKVPGLEGCIHSIDVDRLMSLAPRRTILYEILHPYGFNIATVDEILSGRTRSGAMFFSSSHEASLQGSRLLLAPKDMPMPQLRLTIAPCVSPNVQALPSTEILVDADLLHQPLVLRPWAEGDRFSPFGMKGFKLVSDFLKEQRVSRIERRYVNLLVDADGQVVWVVGFRADNRFRLTESTRQAFRVIVHPF